MADLSEFWNGEEEIKLMDPNLLACPDHERLIEQLIESRALWTLPRGSIFALSAVIMYLY